jgi:signal transduction histidine kinase
MHALSRIARSYKHLLGLINDVLNFVRLGAGKVEFAIAAVPIVEALTSVEAMIGPDLEKKQIGYRFEECDPSLAVHADRDKVQQILLNVLSNAVKFTPQHGRIVVTCTQRGDEVDVAIRDTGPGIAPDRTGAVFEPFVQVERALNRPHDGVGLGLAISRDLARAMGGDLVVESSPPNGSVFIVRLPAAHVASRTAAA